MIVIKILILLICSIPYLGCSKKPSEESTPPHEFQIRILQKNDKNEFQSRNLTDELNFTDIIYLDSSKDGIFHYKPHMESSNIQMQGHTKCIASNELTTQNSFSFSTNQILVHDLLPQETLISLVNQSIKDWRCSFDILFLVQNSHQYRVRFSNKTITRADIVADEIMYQSNAIPFHQTTLKESDFKNIMIQKQNGFNAAELVCENHSSLVKNENNNPIYLDDLVQNMNKFLYKKSILDPRVQMPSQNCLIRILQKNKYIYSYVFNINHRSPRPEFSCVIHKRYLTRGTQTRVASMYYKNKYSFPLTFGRNTQISKIYGNRKWETNSREGAGSVHEKSYLLPAAVHTEYPFRKTFGIYEYYWLAPGEMIEINIGIQVPDQDFNVLNMNEMCKLILVQFSSDSFEELRHVGVYSDPN